MLSCLPRAEVSGSGPEGLTALLKDLTAALTRLNVGVGGSGATPPPVVYLDEVAGGVEAALQQAAQAAARRAVWKKNRAQFIIVLLPDGVRRVYDGGMAISARGARRTHKALQCRTRTTVRRIDCAGQRAVRAGESRRRWTPGHTHAGAPR